MMDVPAPCVFRLLATNVPSRMRYTPFYDALYSFFTTQIQTSRCAQDADAQANVLKNALLLPAPTHKKDAPEPLKNDTPEPLKNDTDAFSTNTNVCAPSEDTSMALVDVTNRAIADALCDTTLVCRMDHCTLRWQLLGSFAPTQGPDVTDPSPTKARHEHTQDREEEEEDVVRLCAVSSRAVCAVYGRESDNAWRDAADSQEVVTDGTRVRAERETESTLVAGAVLALYVDLEHALHQLMGCATTTTLEPRYVRGLRRLAPCEILIRVPRRVAHELAKLRCSACPLEVPHVFLDATAKGTDSVSLAHAPDPSSTALSSTSPSSQAFLTITSPSETRLHTLWVVESSPRRRVDGFLLEQVEAAAMLTSLSMQSFADGQTTRQSDAPATQDTQTNPAFSDARMPFETRKRARTAPLAVTPPSTTVPASYATPLTSTSPGGWRTLRLAPKAEVLSAMAAVMTATGGRVGAWRDAYGNLFFPPVN